MKFEPWMNVFGDQSFRGNCPKEDYVLSSFIAHVRRVYPDTYGLVAFHPKNEGKRTGAQSKADSIKGLTKGVCDVVIIGNPVLCLEIKRQDHTQSKWSGPEQVAFLKQSLAGGAYVAVSLGYDASIQAFEHWLTLQK